MGTEVLFERATGSLSCGREGGTLGAWCPRRFWWPTKGLRMLGLSFRARVKMDVAHHGKTRNDE